MKNIFLILSFLLSSCSSIRDNNINILADQCYKFSQTLNKLSLDNIKKDDYKKILKLYYDAKAVCNTNAQIDLKIIEDMKRLNLELNKYEH